MKEKTAVFIGHSECFDVDREQLEMEIIKLIHRGVRRFLSGGMGGFDRLCARTVFRLKKRYPDIKNMIVIPYPDYNVFEPALFDASEYPECVAVVPYRAKIIRRNQFMVDNSDYAICYVNYSFGGAAKTLEYAVKHDCEIIKIKNRQQH